MTKPSANTGAYFRHHLRKQLPYLLILTLSSLLFTLLFLFEEVERGIDANTDSLFYLPAVFLSLFSVITPIVELVSFKNRRNLDVLYAMPISRRAILSVHLAVGLIGNLIAHAVSFFTVFLFWLPHASYFRLSYAIPLYFLSLLCGIVMYILLAFLFYEGSNGFDGFMTQLYGVFSLPVVLLTLGSFLNEISYTRTFSNKLLDFIQHTFFWSPINDFTTIFQAIIECETYYGLSFRSDDAIYNPAAALQAFFTEGAVLLMLALFLLLTVGAVFDFYKTTYYKPVEQVGEITTSFFSYRLMIPLYSFCFAFVFAVTIEGVIMVALLLALTFASYILYRRTIRLQTRDWVTLLVLLLVCSIFAIL